MINNFAFHLAYMLCLRGKDLSSKGDLNGPGGRSDKTLFTEIPFHCRCGTIKILPAEMPQLRSEGLSFAAFHRKWYHPLEVKYFQTGRKTIYSDSLSPFPKPQKIIYLQNYFEFIYNDHEKLLENIALLCFTLIPSFRYFRNFNYIMPSTTGFISIQTNRQLTKCSCGIIEDSSFLNTAYVG